MEAGHRYQINDIVENALGHEFHLEDVHHVEMFNELDSGSHLRYVIKASCLEIPEGATMKGSDGLYYKEKDGALQVFSDGKWFTRYLTVTVKLTQLEPKPAKESQVKIATVLDINNAPNGATHYNEWAFYKFKDLFLEVYILLNQGYLLIPASGINIEDLQKLPSKTKTEFVKFNPKSMAEVAAVYDEGGLLFTFNYANDEPYIPKSWSFAIAEFLNKSDLYKKVEKKMTLNEEVFECLTEGEVGEKYQCQEMNSQVMGYTIDNNDILKIAEIIKRYK